MTLCDQFRNKVTFKIAYCGPSGSGKTENLHHIQKKLDPHFRGELIVEAEENGSSSREFLPVNAPVLDGCQTQFNLYTVSDYPGSSRHCGNLLQDVDDIIFVADSDPTRLGANIKALQSTRQALEINGRNPEEMPFVFQFNKSDLPGAIFPDQLDEALSIQTPSFLCCAISGYQVFATLDHCSQIVLNNFHSSAVKCRERIEEEIVASSSKIALSR